MTDAGLLVLRLTVGSFILVHGTQKLLGWFGGRGVAGARTTVAQRGARPAWLWGPVAALTLTLGAVFTALGLLDPLGPLCVATAMLAVVTLDRHKGFFAHKGGNEHAYLYLASAVALALSGPGRYSLDAALAIALPPALAAIAAVVALVGLLALHALRLGSAPTRQVAR